MHSPRLTGESSHSQLWDPNIASHDILIERSLHYRQHRAQVIRAIAPKPSLGLLQTGQDVETPSKAQPRLFHCIICDKSFTAKRSLARHKREDLKHLAAVNKPIPEPHGCEQCGKTCARKHDLRRHQLEIHKSHEPFNTQHCEEAGGRSDIALLYASPDRQEDDAMHLDEQSTKMPFINEPEMADLFEGLTDQEWDLLSMCPHPSFDDLGTEADTSRIAYDTSRLSSHLFSWDSDCIQPCSMAGQAEGEVSHQLCPEAYLS